MNTLCLLGLIEQSEAATSTDKSLKHLVVSFEAEKWNVVQDSVNTNGTSVFILKAKGDDSIILSLAEFNSATSFVDQGAAYQQVENDMRGRVLTIRSSPLPPSMAGLKFPVNWTCGSYESVTRAHPDVTVRYSPCVRVMNGWWSSFTLVTSPNTSRAETNKINKVLKAIRER